MSAPDIDAALQVKRWEDKAQKKFAIASIWAPFTTHMETSLSYGNDRDSIPGGVITVKNFNPDEGSHSTTIPWVGKLTSLPKGGKQTLEGEESSVNTRYKECFFQVERQAIAVEDESLDGSFSRFYRIGSMKTDLLTDNFVESTEYKINRAILQGADHLLTEAEYWTRTSLSVPCTTTYHPKIYTGARSKITWNTSNATYETAIQTRFNAMTTTNNKFDTAAADSIVTLANRRLIPISDAKMAKGGIKYLAVISDVQHAELTTGASNAWMQMFRDAGVRAADNVGLTGVIGMYKGVLFMVDSRSPVYDTAGSTGLYINYVKPSTDDSSGTGTAFLPRVIKTGSGTGTIELARVFGRGGILKAQVGEELKFVSKKFDYDFSNGLAIQRKEGYQRADFGNSGVLEPVNDSSFIFATASPSTES